MKRREREKLMDEIEKAPKEIEKIFHTQRVMVVYDPII
jgi:hypothetical protein